MSENIISASAIGSQHRRGLLAEGEKNRLALANILDRIDAISAAVSGAEFNDKGRQNGISLLLGDVWCTLSDLIEEMGGRRIHRDKEEDSEDQP